MPSVKGRASKILNEYGGAQSELIGKTVVLYRRKGRHGRERLAGRIAGFGYRSKAMMEDGRSQPSSLWRARPALRPLAAQSAFLSEHSEQYEKPNLGQEADAHDRDSEKYVARR